MADVPYQTVGEPNYAAPIVNLFGKQGQQGAQTGNAFASALRRFLTPQGAVAPGSAVPGASGPTSVGGPNGPTPLVQPQGNQSPFSFMQGMGF
jgi:hypothetical protein